MARINYIELPVVGTDAAKRFYADAFGWTFTDFGPTYAATTTGDTDIGFQADPDERSAGPLTVIQVEDLDATLATVVQAGGAVTAPIFAFPGGRCFHVRDRDGHKLAAMQPGGD